MYPEEPQELIRQILENLRTPERLDTHPWADGRFVREAASEDPSLASRSAGGQLAGATLKIFTSLMPATPPRHGKRLDTRWGEFGLLAAQYFAPFAFGIPSPQSLREAWSKIDQAIVWFVFKKSPASLSESDLSLYKLVGSELETAANSTISDWHRKGISHLAETIKEREDHLSRSSAQHPNALGSPASAGQTVRSQPGQANRSIPAKNQKRIFFGCLAILLLVNIFLAVKTLQIYQLAQKVRQELGQIQALVSDKPSLDTFRKIEEPITSLHADLSQLRTDASLPLKAAGPLLGWLPVYGPDISAAPDLLEMADLLSSSAQLSIQAAGPIIDSLQAKAGPISPPAIARQLVEIQPQLQDARKNLADALVVRARINAGALSPRTSALIDKLDPMLGLLDDGLTGLLSLPKILGASSAGPQTYMLLIQNEDELRATGGFLTSVGSFVVRDGDIFGMKFQSSDEYEDRTKPYPAAPWQMNQYMNIPATFLRDGNWSPDFPSSFSLVEYLYAYENNHSVDGVIAIDQHALVVLLKAIGPITIPDVPEPISADNVITYMREAKITPQNVKPSDWDRKAFIGNMASAIMLKLRSGKGLDIETLAHSFQQVLDQRHILLQFDDPDMTGLLARRGWDGAVRVGTGDFLMSVDTNIGFNKTSSVVKEKISYDVDLTNLASPKSSLVVFHENFAVDVPACLQWGRADNQDPYTDYPINRCYFDYFRVYLPTGASLLDATPHAIPGEWMILGQPVPAKVDTLNMDFEKIGGATGFGTLLVVPGMKSLNTSFDFALPAGVIATVPGSREKSYTLKIQKQAGTLATPLTLRIHLPNQAQVISVDPAASIDSNNILLETKLVTDVTLKVIFSIP